MNAIGSFIRHTELNNFLNVEEIREGVNEIHWTHILDFGNGVVTPGFCLPMSLDGIGCLEDLHGMTVLDIGAADGGYSFQAERRGAARVLATDSWLWGDMPGSSKAAFDFARKVLNSKVESGISKCSIIRPKQQMSLT